jgi:acyl carrier protein
MVYSDIELEQLVRTTIASVAPNADFSRVGPDDDLVEALELDSMDVLNVVAAIAETTGLEVAERNYPRTRTLRGFVAELARLAEVRGTTA